MKLLKYFLILIPLILFFFLMGCDDQPSQSAVINLGSDKISLENRVKFLPEDQDTYEIIDIYKVKATEKEWACVYHSGCFPLDSTPVVNNTFTLESND